MTKKFFREEKPKQNQIFVFKTFNGEYPEVGVFQIFDNGREEIYIPANDDMDLPDSVDWWCEIPE